MNDLENWLDNDKDEKVVAEEDGSNNNIKSDKNRICKHVCEKKKRRCKFNAIRNSDYCVEHLAFNTNNQDNDEEKTARRVICPLDPKHSVYEKNFKKHLLKCNARVKHLDENDDRIENHNKKERCNKTDLAALEEELTHKLQLTPTTTYKDLSETQLKCVIDFLAKLDAELGLCSTLRMEKIENAFISEELKKKNQWHQKHMRQIASIVGHVGEIVDTIEDSNSRCCLVELGAGRGRLSYWYEQSRQHSTNASTKNTAMKKKLAKNVPTNILLIERGSQRLKYDSMLKKDLEDEGDDRDDAQAEFARIRIDLKDLFINKVPLIQTSSSFVMYGKHLCGVATDFALRCLKHSLLDAMASSPSHSEETPKFRGLVLAVCCHHQCEWESLCGSDFLRSRGIGSMLFYIIRSISSWSTSGDRNITAPNEYIFGHQRQKMGRICKNLIDYARIQYLKSIPLAPGFELHTNYFYYIEPEVTLENTLIQAYLNKI